MHLLRALVYWWLPETLQTHRYREGEREKREGGRAGRKERMREVEKGVRREGEGGREKGRRENSCDVTNVFVCVEDWWLLKLCKCTHI